MWVSNSLGVFEAWVASESGVLNCYRTGLPKASYKPGDWIAMSYEPVTGEAAEFLITIEEQADWKIVSGPA